MTALTTVDLLILDDTALESMSKEEGKDDRPRLKPKLDDAQPPSNPSTPKRRPHPRSQRRR
jgi:hypothetical protein